MAILGVVVLVVAIVAITEPKQTTTSAAGKQSSTAAAPTRSTTTSTSTSRSPSPTAATSAPAQSGSSSSPGDSGAAARKVPLVVLNNTTTLGLANVAATRFRAAGWTVSDTGNLRNEIVSTCAYYDPADPTAKAAAQALQQEFPTIKRVVAKFAELPAGPVVVVLTPDYTSG
ncbi:MAG: LytR C-terminal domain-containing protein [Jatrophihabitans sp.]